MAIDYRSHPNDAFYSLTNSQLLKENSDLVESLENSSKHCSAKSSTEKSLTNIRKTWNDRSFRLVSNSSGFAHNPGIFEHSLCKTPQKSKKKRDESLDQTPDVNMAKSQQENSDPMDKTPERYSAPKQYRHREEFKNMFEFLNSKRWHLVTYGDLNYKLDWLQSSSIDWHIEKGYAPYNRRSAHIVVTAFNQKVSRTLRQNSHVFAYRREFEDYDISKINLDAPDGTSIFQTENERILAENNYAKLMNKYQSQIYNLNKKMDCKRQFLEQMPVSANTTCTIWNVRFSDIFTHMESDLHKESIKDFQSDYDQLDKLWAQLDSQLKISKPAEKVPAKPPVDAMSMPDIPSSKPLLKKRKKVKYFCYYMATTFLNAQFLHF